MCYSRFKTEKFTRHRYQTNELERTWSFIVSIYAYLSFPTCVEVFLIIFSSQTCAEVQNTLIWWRSPNERPVTLDSVAFSVEAFRFSTFKYISSFRVAKISVSKHQTNPSWTSAYRICFPVYCSSWNPDNNIFRLSCNITLHIPTQTELFVIYKVFLRNKSSKPND
jgi:hypothetical protein